MRLCSATGVCGSRPIVDVSSDTTVLDTVRCVWVAGCRGRRPALRWRWRWRVDAARLRGIVDGARQELTPSAAADASTGADEEWMGPAPAPAPAPTPPPPLRRLCTALRVIVARALARVACARVDARDAAGGELAIGRDSSRGDTGPSRCPWRVVAGVGPPVFRPGPRTNKGIKRRCFHTNRRTTRHDTARHGTALVPRPVHDGGDDLANDVGDGRTPLGGDVYALQTHKAQQQHVNHAQLTSTRQRTPATHTLSAWKETMTLAQEPLTTQNVGCAQAGWSHLRCALDRQAAAAAPCGGWAIQAARRARRASANAHGQGAGPCARCGLNFRTLCPHRRRRVQPSPFAGPSERWTGHRRLV